MISEVRRWAAQAISAYQAECPVLEVGSFNVNGSLRDLFDGQYVGLDMREGPGVDVMADIVTDGWYRAGMMLDGEDPHFKTVVCTETLEHVTYPHRAIGRMYDALQPGGLILLTVPFLWEFHDYPNDYWRISPPCMEMLLQDAGFTNIDCAWGGNKLTDRYSTHTYAVARRPV